MFPDNHTFHPEVSDGRRAFLMGNALVCGVVQAIGKSLYRFIYEEEPVSHKPIEMQRDSRRSYSLKQFSQDFVQFVKNHCKKKH